jgi:hypothetical protein
MKGGDGRAVFANGCGRDGGEFGDNFFLNAGTSASRLHSGIETEIGAVTMIVDAKAIMGMPLGTLADHFALLALAEGRFSSSCKEVESIANLFHKDCNPALTSKEITSNDLTMLTSLYGTQDQTIQLTQSARIIGRMRRALEAQRQAEAGK